jgi:glycosyl transferase family 25
VLNDKFQRIFCINLDRRPDRWEQSVTLFSDLGIVVERVPAIESNPPWNGLRKTVVSIFERALKDDLETILILEDDVDWSKEFPTEFDRCWKVLPNDWDMFYFSAAHQYWPDKENELLFRLRWSTAAHAIAFNRKCFRTVLTTLMENKEPIDVTYSRLQEDLNAYCCIEPIAWQRKSFSDIEGEEKWYPYLKDIGFYDKYNKGLITIDGKEKNKGCE